MIFSSLIGGGVTGILGSLISNVTDIWKDHARRKHDLALRRLDLEMMDKEWEYRDRASEREGETRLIESGDEMRSDSFKADRLAYARGLNIEALWLKASLVFVDVVRGLVRPGLTLYLVWIVQATRSDAESIIRAAGLETINATQALTIYSATVDMLLFLAATAVTWWFGTRPIKKTK